MRLIYALFSIILLNLPMVASADYLDIQIAELTKQKQEKIKILEECQKNTKGLKIAGLTTLGVSAIGVGVNIGEAVMLKGQKSDIADKEKQLDELDSKISSTKILITENNTCGPSDCQGDGNAAAVTLNGIGPVCINNNWAVKECMPRFSGRLKKCKRKGVEISYYDACATDYSYDSCGSANCTGEKAEAMKALHGKPAICINDNWAVQSCDDGYSGVEQQCKRNGVLVKYFHQCTKPNTCGSSNCTGDGSTEAQSARGSLPICVGDIWHVTVCNDGYSGVTSTCTRDGVKYSYYANGCSKVSVPEGVTVRDKGDGIYEITIGGNKFDVKPEGAIAKIEGQPGNYRYKTRNGNIYNIGTVNVYGGKGGNGTVDGNIDINWNFNGMDGLSNINLVQGNNGTLKINGIVEGLILEVASSNEEVVTVSVNGNNVTITPVGVGTANITLVVKEEKTGAIKWQQIIPVVVSGPEVCTVTPNECSETDKPQNVKGDLICLNKIWWAKKCADDYTPRTSLECNGTKYVRDCYKVESSEFLLEEQNAYSINNGLYVLAEEGPKQIVDEVGALVASVPVIGRCSERTESFENIYEPFEIKKSVCKNEQNEQVLNGWLGSKCGIVACKDSRQYLRVTDIRNNIFSTMDNAAQSCMSNCNQGVDIQYKFADKQYNACVLNISVLLEKCIDFCKNNSVPETGEEYVRDKCTLDLVGIDQNTKQCVCNPDVTTDEQGKSAVSYKFFHDGSRSGIKYQVDLSGKKGKNKRKKK